MTTPSTETTEIATDVAEVLGNPAPSSHEAAEPMAAVPADAGSVAHEHDTEDQGGDEEIDTSTRSGRDAAKYRAQLRDAEAQRDTATAALAAQQRAIVNHHAGTAGAGRAPVKPELLDANGFDLATVLDDNGMVDLAAVETFATATAEHFGIRLQGFTPNRGQGGGGAGLFSTGAPKGIAGAFRQ